MAAELNSSGKKNSKPRKNGGRFGFDDYANAPVTVHDVEGVSVGDVCKHCGKGKYYYGKDKKLIEFTGGPILTVKKHIKKTLRCNGCGHEQSKAKSIPKWTPEARSAIVLHKVLGAPWYRMSRIQTLCGIPVAISTFWHQAEGVWEDTAKHIVPVLYNHAAESKFWFTDDTGMQILEVTESNKALEESKRRACHATAICAMHEEHRINLYITSNHYCRENWLELLEKRKDMDKLVMMTDASNQSLPNGSKLNGYNIYLTTIPSTADLPEFSSRKISELPVLVKKGNAIYVYGKKPKAKKDEQDCICYTELEAAAFNSLPFPDSSTTVEVKSNKEQIPLAIFDAIAARKGHCQLDLDRIIPAVCLGGHGKRKFEDLKHNYPNECAFFLEQISLLYKNEKDCANMDPKARLVYHQLHSTPIIDVIYNKIAELFDQKIIEPNSDLGGAMKYWLNHKEALTVFLRVEGVKIDNNWAEFTLRLMALYRNASLFFKTKRSAIIMNDLFSLVSTCEANKINAFEYLNWIQLNWKNVQEHPEQYLPWHFKIDTEKIAIMG